MAPRVGFEPTTSRLTAGCSTTELPRIRVGALYIADRPAQASAPNRERGRMPPVEPRSERGLPVALFRNAGIRAASPAASWRSGYAEDCKSLHPGSIPGEASIPRSSVWIAGDQGRRRCEGDHIAFFLAFRAVRLAFGAGVAAFLCSIRCSTTFG